ncbi:MAG: hypothetical protein WCF33_12920, partial [Pseudonocardiaceae bacterium]
ADTARHEPSPALHAFVALRHAVAHAQLGDEVELPQMATWGEKLPSVATPHVATVLSRTSPTVTLVRGVAGIGLS